MFHLSVVRDVLIKVEIEINKLKGLRQMDNLFLRFEDVMALIPEDDIVGPKPSSLRKSIKKMPKYRCRIAEVLVNPIDETGNGNDK